MCYHALYEVKLRDPSGRHLSPIRLWLGRSFRSLSTLENPALVTEQAGREGLIGRCNGMPRPGEGLWHFVQKSCCCCCCCRQFCQTDRFLATSGSWVMSMVSHESSCEASKLKFSISESAGLVAWSGKGSPPTVQFQLLHGLYHVLP